MEKVFQRISANHFSELKGTTVDASIPVSQNLINEIIEESLRGNKSIHSLQISVHGQNRVVASLKTSQIPWPLNLKLKLDRSVDFASYGSPKIRAWMENNRFLGSLGSLFNALPEGVKLYGDQVVLDLGVFLHTPQQKGMLELVKSADIQTEEGKMLLAVKMEID